VGVFSGPTTVTGRQVARASDPGPTFGMWGISSPMDLIPTRPFQRTGPTVTQDSAMRHSAVWRSLVLRADMVSTLPLLPYTMVAGEQVKLSYTPMILSAPGGPDVPIEEYLYSSQVDLDRAGNHIAIITEVNGYGQPAKLEAQPSTECSVLVRGGKLWKYRIAGKLYDPDVIWHERQYTASGLYVGLSPVAYAAWALGQYLNVQEFATNWFAQGGIPKARLKNTAKTIPAGQTAVIKEAWRASISAGEPFVHGSDWDYEMIQAQEASADWLDAMAASIADVARFMNVPVDMIDGTPTGARTGRTDLTYANIGQRNAQFLVLNLAPAMVRRERKWSRGLLPVKQFCQFDPSELFRMDPMSRAVFQRARIDARTLAPSEAREDWGLPALTDAQVAEFDHWWPAAGNVQGEGPYPPEDVPGEPGDVTDPIDVGDQAAALGNPWAATRLPARQRLAIGAGR
jgi:HK97 family phage portal protein